MKIQERKHKKPYQSPEIVVVELDQEISLAMESDMNPEGEPGWTQAEPMNFERDPFHIDKA